MRTAKRFFEILRQGEEEVCIASLARWNAQLEGLVELERCRDMMQEVKLLSERREILKGILEDKKLGCRAEQRKSITNRSLRR